MVESFNQTKTLTFKVRFFLLLNMVAFKLRLGNPYWIHLKVTNMENHLWRTIINDDILIIWIVNILIIRNGNLYPHPY